MLIEDWRKSPRSDTVDFYTWKTEENQDSTDETNGELVFVMNNGERRVVESKRVLYRFLKKSQYSANWDVFDEVFGILKETDVESPEDLIEAQK